MVEWISQNYVIADLFNHELYAQIMYIHMNLYLTTRPRLVNKFFKWMWMNRQVSNDELCADRSA